VPVGARLLLLLDEVTLELLLLIASPDEELGDELEDDGPGKPELDESAEATDDDEEPSPTAEELLAGT
jgi:hypothetical protein